MYSGCKDELVWECGGGNFQPQQKNSRARICNGVSPFVLSRKEQPLREEISIGSRLYPKISESERTGRPKTGLGSSTARGDIISVKSQAKSYLAIFHGDIEKYAFPAPQYHERRARRHPDSRHRAKHEAEAKQSNSPWRLFVISGPRFYIWSYSFG